MNYQFEKGSGENECQYPLTQEQLDNLKPCRLASPCVGDAKGTIIPDDFNIEESALEVLRLRLEVEKGIFPYWFMDKHNPFKEEFGVFPRMTPEVLKREGLSFDMPQGLADVVHMDLPTDLPFAIHKWLLSEGQNVKEWTPNHVNFLETVPNVIENVADGTKRGLREVFKVKYAHGVARPEEVLEKMLGITGVLFTAYPEGSPTHPSTGQGHIAAAIGGANELIKSFDLDKAGKEMYLREIVWLVYMWGQFRCLAGVHYGMDSIVSLVASPWKKYLRKEIVEKYTKK